MSKNYKKDSIHSPCEFDTLPYPGWGSTPVFFSSKEITNMPYITFFSVLDRPGENRKEGLQPPPWLDKG